MIENKFYTTQQMCELFGISQTTLWRYRELNQLPRSIKLGGKRRWLREDVDRFIERRFEGEV